MGTEAFQVILKVRLSLREVVTNLQLSCLNIVEDSSFEQEEKWKYFRYRDGAHIIEIEASERNIESTNISCRFAICHPDSIESAFFGFLNYFLKEILPNDKTEEILLVEEVPENMPYSFDIDDMENFRVSLLEAIKIKREYWILDFGNERATLTCDEAIKKFVMRL